MSAPRRSTSQVSPPHGCGLRRRRTSPRYSSSTGPAIRPRVAEARRSEPGPSEPRVEVALRPGNGHLVERADDDLDPREAGRELGDGAARPAEGPGERLRLAHGEHLGGIGHEDAVD